MQKDIFLSIGLVLFLISHYQNVSGQSFKGIIPIKSTCQDVQVILGGEGCNRSQESFVLPNESVEIAYTTEKCPKIYGKNRNVPIGTVIFIARSFIKPLKLEEIGITINNSEYFLSTNDIVGQLIYNKKNREVEIVVTHGYVNEIFYFPSSTDQIEVCKTPKRKSKKQNSN